MFGFILLSLFLWYHVSSLARQLDVDVLRLRGLRAAASRELVSVSAGAAGFCRWLAAHVC
jgi:hypothetical protein